ncbi:MAG: outer membrane beta-barrel protein [Bacteroidales bacterium]
MVKKILIASILSVALLTVAAGQRVAAYTNLPDADEKPVSFGFGVGLNTQDYSFGFSRPGLLADLPETALNYHVQLIGSFTLTPSLSLRLQPGVIIPSELPVAFYEAGTREPLPTLPEELSDISRFSFVMPVLLKYSAKRYRNIRPYLVAGLSPRISRPNRDHSVLALKDSELLADAGAGIDIYLPYTKMIIECRGSFGLNNSFDGYRAESPHRPQSGVNKMISTGYFLTVYFEGGFLNFF